MGRSCRTRRWSSGGWRRAIAPLRTGYLEAVATLPAFERRGYGSMVVRAATKYLLPRFELGALSTSVPGFYLRLGWEPWLGPTFVRTASGVERTEDDDGGDLRPAHAVDPAARADRAAHLRLAQRRRLVGRLTRRRRSARRRPTRSARSSVCRSLIGVRELREERGARAEDHRMDDGAVLVDQAALDELRRRCSGR